jgi:hypothetical protein
MVTPRATPGPGSCHTTVRERCGPQSSFPVRVAGTDPMVQSPGQQCVQHRQQCTARIRELVVEPRWRRPIGDALDYPGLLQRLDPGRHPVPGCAGAANNVLEAAVPQRQLAHNQQRPAFADHVQGGGDRAGPAGEVGQRDTGHAHQHVIAEFENQTLREGWTRVPRRFTRCVTNDS